MKNEIPTRPARVPGRLRLLGISLAGLSFLTVPAVADTLDDALRCLGSQEKAAALRDRLLAQADSLGRVIEAARASGASAPERLLRQAEKIKTGAMDQALEWMTAQASCRALAEQALPVCEQGIARLQGSIRSGSATSADASALLRLQQVRSRLQDALEGPVTVTYHSLPIDSSDTQEVLRAKLQYYQDVHGYLQSLDRRVSARLKQVADERRTLVEAQRFLRDMDFLDEGGRVAPGRAATVPGLPPGGDGTPGSAARPAGSAELGGRAGDLELVLGLTPVTPEESDRLIRLLKGFREEIQGELEAVSRDAEAVRGRILPDLSPSGSPSGS